MARLIDADAFLDWLVKRFHCIPLVGSSDKNSESMKFILAQAPTVDALEVVHGRWNMDEEMYAWNCSVCRSISLNGRRYSYCHNCGARMDLEVE